MNGVKNVKESITFSRIVVIISYIFTGSYNGITSSASSSNSSSSSACSSNQSSSTPAPTPVPVPSNNNSRIIFYAP